MGFIGVGEAGEDKRIAFGAQGRLFALLFCLSLKKVELKTRVLGNVCEMQRQVNTEAKLPVFI